MKTAILIHGWAYKDEFYDEKFPTSSNSHWFPWVSKQLMIRGVHVVAIEMPNSFYPEYSIWKKEFERFEIGEDTILVGHSCGGGFLIRWLSENKIKVGKVILVAPWVGNDPDQPFDKSFFEFEWDKDIAERTSGLALINSTNDDPVIHESVDLIKSKVTNVKYIDLENKGHFTLYGMGTVEFPELLQELLS
jgi:predicted alpha/beta hydrolase family esterase